MRKDCTKFFSQKQEQRVAKELQGRTVIASGSLWGSKGDVKSDVFLVECKTTEDTRYSLSLRTWDKIKKEAIRERLRIPIMCIDLWNGRSQLALFEDSSFKGVSGSYSVYPLDSPIKWFNTSVSITPEPTIYKSYRGDVLRTAWWSDFLEMVNNPDFKKEFFI